MGSLEDSQAMVPTATTVISVLSRELHLPAVGKAPLWELIPGVWTDDLTTSTEMLKASIWLDSLGFPL